MVRNPAKRVIIAARRRARQEGERVKIAAEGQGTVALDLGCIPMSGSEGSTEAFAGRPVGRKAFIHLDNSNAALIGGSPWRRRIEKAGRDLAPSFMETAL